MGKKKQPKKFSILPYDDTVTSKWCMVLSAPVGKDVYDIAHDLKKLAKQYPEYNFMLTEAAYVEVSHDRKKRL